MPKKTNNIILALILVAAVAVMGILVWALLPKDCTHRVCAKETFAPDCEEKGYTHYTCLSCGYEFDADFIAPYGHTFVENEYTAPTCEREGYSSRTCTTCGKVDKRDYISPTGHTYNKVVTAPTCEREGYTTYTCTDCGFSVKTEYTKPNGHNYTKTNIVRPAPDRTGYTVYTCTECGTSHKSDFVFYSDIFSGSEGEGRGSLAKGVDLSRYSESVDFEKLKKNGVDFVILRVGSNKNKDVYFDTYYRQARAAGLDVGAYFFTFAESESDARADAKRVAEWLDGKTFEYPIFFDVEDYAPDGYLPSTFSEDKIMKIVSAFMIDMVDYGYYPGIYTNNKFLYEVFNREKTLWLYDVWYARYGNDPEKFCKENIDEYSKLYSMWQYIGDVENYPGVSGICDVNHAFKNYPEIIKKYSFNGYP